MSHKCQSSKCRKCVFRKASERTSPKGDNPEMFRFGRWYNELNNFLIQIRCKTRPRCIWTRPRPWLKVVPLSNQRQIRLRSPGSKNRSTVWRLQSHKTDSGPVQALACSFKARAIVWGATVWGSTVWWLRSQDTDFVSVLALTCSIKARAIVWGATVWVTWDLGSC